ncbi:MAG: hypothetical protein K1060chlam1_00629 [Candidatus Anoxychlamydiales bacterium]|nr:hypothetical protein [Candidatus Anoxychlamydiales bacterium]
MKSIFLILLVVLSLFSPSFSKAEVYSDANEITYEKLINNLGTDHVQHFRKLFSVKKFRNVLEFGMGYGTKYFLDNCDKVTSMEFVLIPEHHKWFDICRKLYRDYPSWKIKKLETPQSLIQADFEARTREGHEIFSYLMDLKRIIFQNVADNTYDLIFVDTGFHPRADIINLLFGKTKVIVAHDTNFRYGRYGWRRIKVPSDYKEIQLIEGSGVTVWIHKSEDKLIQAVSKN